MRYLLYFLICIIFASSIAAAEAWDSTGHRLIAVIAYARLTPQTKHHVDQLTELMFSSPSAERRFLRASIWPDTLRYQDINKFNSWHFIDLPYVKDNIKAFPPNPKNVVWAIQQAERTLENPQTKAYEKAVSLSFLIHFVGDAHQPLHCAELYSDQFPYGDKGGNAFYILSPYANNLHSLWDQGVGYFHIKGERYPLNYYAVQELAQQITQRYPESYFKDSLQQLNPVIWAKNSYYLAKRYAYNIQPGVEPDRDYIIQGQQIAAQQIAIAGYQLAELLNKIVKK